MTGNQTVKMAAEDAWDNSSWKNTCTHVVAYYQCDKEISMCIPHYNEHKSFIIIHVMNLS